MAEDRAAMTLILLTLGALFLTVVVAWLAYKTGHLLGYLKGYKEACDDLAVSEKIRRLDAVDMTTEDAMKAAGIQPIKTEVSYNASAPGRILSEEESAALIERLMSRGRLH